MKRRLEPEGWRELLRQMERALVPEGPESKPLDQQTLKFMEEGRLGPSKIPQLVTDALSDVAEYAGRDRVRYHPATRRALMTAFGAWNIELMAELQRLTQELAASVRENADDLPTADVYNKVDARHERIKVCVDHITKRINVTTYALATLFKMGYGMWELLD